MAKFLVRTFLIFCAILCLDVLIVTAQPISTGNKASGTVLLTALRLDGSALSNLRITVLIEGKNLRREVSLNQQADEMSASVELPVGIYRVSTKRTFDNYKFVRSAFRVRSQTVTRINIFPPYRVSAIFTHLDENGFRDEYLYDEEPKYQTFNVPQNKNKNINLVVQFNQKKQLGKITAFTGANVRAGSDLFKSEGMMASYDSFSIYANELRINSQTLEIEAFGNIVLENGAKRERAERAKIFFEGGELKFQIIAKSK